jgi:hypothetical protein
VADGAAEGETLSFPHGRCNGFGAVDVKPITAVRIFAQNGAKVPEVALSLIGSGGYFGMIGCWIIASAIGYAATIAAAPGRLQAARSVLQTQYRKRVRRFYAGLWGKYGSDSGSVVGCGALENLLGY